MVMILDMIRSFSESTPLLPLSIRSGNLKKKQICGASQPDMATLKGTKMETDPRIRSKESDTCLPVRRSSKPISKPPLAVCAYGLPETD
ncbi:hypothetical protein YC2023_052840 [Brassica napus]